MKFAHLSDSHLGFQQYGREARKDDFSIALFNAVRDIVNTGIKLIVHTGDLLNANRPGPDTIAVLVRINDYLIEHKARMFVISGNHDQTDPHWSFVLKREPMFHYGLSCQDHQVVTIDNVSFNCLPFMSNAKFKEMEFQPGNVLLWHGQIRELLGYPSEHALTMDELPYTKYQLILLGDVHVQKYVQHPKNPHCWVGYPGSTELFRENEDVDKYWTEISFEPGQLADPVFTHYRIKTRPVLRVKIHSEGDIEKMVAKVKAFTDDYCTDGRKPILFLEYPSTLPNVLQRFYAEFDPNQHIIEPRPFFPLEINAPPVPGEEADDLTVDQILRRRLAIKPELTEIALQLVNPEANADACITEYIAARVSAIPGEATNR